jgi:hypothetical protein
MALVKRGAMAPWCRFVLALGLVAGGMLGVCDEAAAYSVLYRFAQNNQNDGYSPFALTGSGAQLYGIATGLGDYAFAPVIFQLDAGKGSESIVGTFDGSTGVGTAPTGLVVSGQLIGLTQDGGTPCGCGTLFSFSGGLEPTLLASLSASAGSVAYAQPIATASGILAMSGSGGGGAGCGGAGCGTVFLLAPPNHQNRPWSQTVVHVFEGDDGGDPSFLLDTGFGVFGTTLEGGSSLSGCAGEGCGTVFQLIPPDANHRNWREATIYSFQDEADGRYPSALSSDSAGNLYGATRVGTFFKLTPPKKGGGWKYTLIYTLGDPAQEGSWPIGMFDVGTAHGNPVFVGATSQGGKTKNNIECVYGCGTTFKLTLESKQWTYTVLHYFKDGSDGAAPNSVTATGGSVYGTTFGGGLGKDGCCGTVFKLQ